MHDRLGGCKGHEMEEDVGVSLEGISHFGALTRGAIARSQRQISLSGLVRSRIWDSSVPRGNTLTVVARPAWDFAGARIAKGFRNQMSKTGLVQGLGRWKPEPWYSCPMGQRDDEKALDNCNSNVQSGRVFGFVSKTNRQGNSWKRRSR